jgi:hypothetical protein
VERAYTAQIGESQDGGSLSCSSRLARALKVSASRECGPPLLRAAARILHLFDIPPCPPWCYPAVRLGGQPRDLDTGLVGSQTSDSDV